MHNLHTWTQGLNRMNKAIKHREHLVYTKNHFTIVLMLTYENKMSIKKEVIAHSYEKYYIQRYKFSFRNSCSMVPGRLNCVKLKFYIKTPQTQHDPENLPGCIPLYFYLISNRYLHEICHNSIAIWDPCIHQLLSEELAELPTILR